MKVAISSKNLWKSYLSVWGTIGILTSFITIFITISSDYKLKIGIGFLILLIIIFFPDILGKQLLKNHDPFLCKLQK